MKVWVVGHSGRDIGKHKSKPLRKPRIRLNMTAWIGAVILLFCVLIGIVGPFISPHPPDEIITTVAFAPPGGAMLMGADYLGRDVFSRMLHGARMTIGLSIAATFLGFLTGMALGFTAAETGGWIDNAISRGIDILISFPPILLSLVVIVGLGNSLTVLVATVGVIHASRVARVSRAIAMDIAAKDFVEVARARGERLWWILRREIWPNSMLPLAAEFGLRFTFSILFLSALSFLGLGIQPPAADWGVMVRENMSGLLYGSWSALLPAAAITTITVGVNFVVDWMGKQTGREISEELLK